jgi:DNA modification methylase
MKKEVFAEQKDWSFAETSRTETGWGPHGYHRYPAKFIPQLVARIIQEYADPGSCIGDLFLGSGTTGVEALRRGHRFYGADINPVACLISQAKCVPLQPDTIRQTWNDLNARISEIAPVGRKSLASDEKAIIESIDIARASLDERLKYWFPKAQRVALEGILQEILIGCVGQYRVFMLCAFSNILKRCSIWLSGSTKAQKDLEKVVSDPVEEFRKQVNDMLKRNSLYWDDLRSSNINPEEIASHLQIVQQDARQLSESMPSLDLLATSPPYATCYEYSDLHQLTQVWLEKAEFIKPIAPKRDWIGSRGTTSLSYETSLNTGSLASDEALADLEALASANHSSRNAIMREVNALRRYFQDMNQAMYQMARVVRSGKRMVLVIGDSCKRDVAIPTTNALEEMACTAGFAVQERIVRRVAGRVLVSTRNRVTGRFSSTSASDSQVYPEENILIFKRL